MESLSWLFVLQAIISHVCYCSPWISLTDDQLQYACAGHSLTIPWHVNMSATQSIKDIQWFFVGQSEEMIAIFSHGHFMPMPAYAQRAKQVGDAGIEVTEVTSQDSGNYSVEISVVDTSDTLTSLIQHAIVHVNDGLMTTDGRLHVLLSSEPVFDSSTRQWSLELTCGQFTYVGRPPFDVLWTLPDGTTVLSSSFDDGHFKLLTAPAVGGTYTCQIPSSAAAVVCLPASLNSSLNVDETKAELILINAQMTTVLKENEDLKNQVNHLDQKVHDLTTQQVSFLAKPSTDIANGAAGSRLIFGSVINNVGNAYDASSGQFTAPYPGSYFFAASSRCGTAGQVGDFRIMSSRGNTILCQADSNTDFDSQSCQAVAHLAKGDQVWLIPVDSYCYRAESTVFSGFLINVDP